MAQQDLVPGTVVAWGGPAGCRVPPGRGLGPSRHGHIRLEHPATTGGGGSGLQAVHPGSITQLWVFILCCLHSVAGGLPGVSVCSWRSHRAWCPWGWVLQTGAFSAL